MVDTEGLNPSSAYFGVRVRVSPSVLMGYFFTSQRGATVDVALSNRVAFGYASSTLVAGTERKGHV